MASTIPPPPPPPPMAPTKKLKTSKVRLLKSSASKCGYFILFDYPDFLGRKRETSAFSLTDVEMTEEEATFFSNSEARSLINPLQKAGLFRLRRNHENSLFTWMRHFADRDNEWLGLRPWQIANHLPAGELLSKKNILASKMRHYHKLFPSAYNFAPETFVMPEQMAMFQKVARAEPTTTWILKPYSCSRGRGIKIFSNVDEIVAEVNKEPEPLSFVQQQIKDKVPRKKVPLPSEVVLQRYVPDPHLIDGLKYDLRVYVLATSFDPLCVYLFKEGLGRFCTTKYNAASDLNDRFAHLTNTSINKFSNQYESNTGTTEAEMARGSKRTFTSVIKSLAEMGADTRKVQARMEELIIKTLIVIGEDSHAQAKTVNFDRSKGFEFYGFDIILNSKLQPTLLELNFMPDICAFMPMDKVIKGVLVADILSLAGVQPPPPALKRAGLAKPVSSITRTPAEEFVHELQEQELRKGDFHLIFPLRDTAANYIPFFTCAEMRDELKKIVPLLPASNHGGASSSPAATTAETAAASPPVISTTTAAAAAAPKGSAVGNTDWGFYLTGRLFE